MIAISELSKSVKLQQASAPNKCQCLFFPQCLFLCCSLYLTESRRPRRHPNTASVPPGRGSAGAGQAPPAPSPLPPRAQGVPTGSPESARPPGPRGVSRSHSHQQLRPQHPEAQGPRGRRCGSQLRGKAGPAPLRYFGPFSSLGRFNCNKCTNASPCFPRRFPACRVLSHEAPVPAHLSGLFALKLRGFHPAGKHRPDQGPPQASPRSVSLPESPGPRGGASAAPLRAPRVRHLPPATCSGAWAPLQEPPAAAPLTACDRPRAVAVSSPGVPLASGDPVTPLHGERRVLGQGLPGFGSASLPLSGDAERY